MSRPDEEYDGPSSTRVPRPFVDINTPARHDFWGAMLAHRACTLLRQVDLQQRVGRCVSQEVGCEPRVEAGCSESRWAPRACALATSAAVHPSLRQGEHTPAAQALQRAPRHVVPINESTVCLCAQRHHACTTWSQLRAKSTVSIDDVDVQTRDMYRRTAVSSGHRRYGGCLLWAGASLAHFYSPRLTARGTQRRHQQTMAES